jgi:hypothetical protein
MASQTGWIYSQEHGKYYYQRFVNGQWHTFWQGDYSTAESAPRGRNDSGTYFATERQSDLGRYGYGAFDPSALDPSALDPSALDPSTNSYWLNSIILTVMAGYYVRTGQEASDFFQPGRVCMSSVTRRIVLNYFG